MTQSDIWAYGLAPDVMLDETGQVARLNSPVGSINLTDNTHVTLARKLVQGCSSEAELTACLTPGSEAQDACASFLFRLDRHGFLSRFLMQGTRMIAACVPQRARLHSLPAFETQKVFQLSARVLLQPQKQGFRAQVAGSWAVMDLFDPQLGPLLFGLSGGIEATQVPSQAPWLEPRIFEALMRLFAWCDLLGDPKDRNPPVHEALFHSHTRNGFIRTKLGKTGNSQPLGQFPKDVPQVALPLPDVADLMACDPPHVLVSRLRQSRREQGREPITSAQLGELLFRCFYQENGRRPYPSGGGVYPLTAYLVVHCCDGLAPGLYAYDAMHHRLGMIAEFNPSLKHLLSDAAAAANGVSEPQILLLLSADMVAMRTAYGDLAYSLVLKEVGAVYQSVQLAGEAMKLAICPLGTGNSVAFAHVSGLDLHDMPSVGEMMIGSLG